MGIDLVALLKGTDHSFPPNTFVQRLSDAVLVTTGMRFGGEPDEVAFTLRARYGDALDAHDDPRGIFVLPDIAEPRATTYEGVIAEIGEAGEWIQKAPADPIPERYAGAPDASLAGLMGQVMSALGGDMIGKMTRALTSGDPEALARAQAEMIAALGGEERVEALGKQFLDASNAEAGKEGPGATPFPLDLGGLNLDNPDIESMAKRLQQNMEESPDREALEKAGLLGKDEKKKP